MFDVAGGMCIVRESSAEHFRLSLVSSLAVVGRSYRMVNTSDLERPAF